jgi:DNA repair protein RadC
LSSVGPAHDCARVEEDRIIQQALNILEARCSPGECVRDSDAVAQYLRLRLGGLKNECFAVLYLNTQCEILAFKEHFHGSIDCASVYPRVVVQTALDVNAAAVIFAHNHPSGLAEPSEADRQITRKLVQALDLVDVRVLDHFVVSAKGAVSFVHRGLLASARV